MLKPLSGKKLVSLNMLEKAGDYHQRVKSMRVSTCFWKASVIVLRMKGCIIPFRKF
jgi:hypothetical protein